MSVARHVSSFRISSRLYLGRFASVRPVPVESARFSVCVCVCVCVCVSDRVRVCQTECMCVKESACRREREREREGQRERGIGVIRLYLGRFASVRPVPA